MREGGVYYFESMGLKSDWNVVLKREEIVDIDCVVLAACYEESTVRSELEITNVGTVSGLVFFQENQRFKTSINATAFIYSKALLLTYTE